MPQKGQKMPKEFGRKISETKKKIFKEHPEKRPCLGRILSEETKSKISESNKGKKLSKEHKEKLSKAHKGKTSWIKGKKHSEEAKKHMSEARKKYYKTHPHPKGMLGRHCTEETKRKLSITSSSRPNFYTKENFREDLQQFFRSSWEANFARILNYLKEPYEYEKHRFDLGLHFYIPDFYLPNQNIFYEIKGFMNERSKRKLDKFRELYPKEKLLVVDLPIYKRLREEYGNIIQNWEGRLPK